MTTVGDGEPPCRIEFRATGVRLEADPDGSRPDPGRTVVMDSSGRFVSANAPGWGAAISVWDARGGYLHSFGSEGEGPGELAAGGMLSVFMDGRDRVHVRDNRFAWSVFSERHEFIRRAPAQALGGMTGYTVFLEDGSAVAGDERFVPGAAASHHFRMVDSTGALRRTFGPRPGASARPGWLRRPVSHAGGDTFWAGPPDVGYDGYVLEEWGTDGELRRAISRDLAWYRWSGERETSPSVRQLHAARGGLLYVMVRRPTAEYRREFERAARRGERIATESRDGMTEVLLEVVDTRSGELLASDSRSATEARRFLPRALFRGSLLGYRYEVGPDGLPFVEIVKLELIPR